MRKLFIIISFIVFGVLFLPPKSYASAPSLAIVPNSGTAGTYISIIGTGFCTMMPGTPVTITFGGKFVSVGTGPNFTVYYTVQPSDPIGYTIINGTAPACGDSSNAAFTVTVTPTPIPTSTPTPATSGSSKKQTTVSASPSVSVSGSISPSASVSGTPTEQKSEENLQVKPWYKNWKYLLLIGIGTLLLAGNIVWLVIYLKKKKKSKTEKKIRAII